MAILLPYYPAAVLCEGRHNEATSRDRPVLCLWPCEGDHFYALSDLFILRTLTRIIVVLSSTVG